VVRTGQKVQQGQVIGFIGNTGLSTGPHLHYELHWGSELVDPLEYIGRRGRFPFPADRINPVYAAEVEQPVGQDLLAALAKAPQGLLFREFGYAQDE
jgi:murein DD-endopeptidase MepM/ murein hydrolase activator NlpD